MHLKMRGSPHPDVGFSTLMSSKKVLAGAAGFSNSANATDTRGAPGHEVVQLA